MWGAWPGSRDCREPDWTGPCPCPTQDFQFILKGIARLLSNPLLQTYLPNSTKKIQFHQELLVLFWKLCDFNKVGRPLWRCGGTGWPAAVHPWGAEGIYGDSWEERGRAAPLLTPPTRLPSPPRNSSSLC